MWHHGHGWLWPGTPFLHTPSWDQFHSSPWCSRKETAALRTWATHPARTRESRVWVSAPSQARLQTWHPTPLLGNRPGAWHPQAPQNGGSHVSVVIRPCNDQMREILPVKKSLHSENGLRGEDHGCTSVNRAGGIPHALGPNSPGIRNTGQDGSLRPHLWRWGWEGSRDSHHFCRNSQSHQVWHQRNARKHLLGELMHISHETANTAAQGQPLPATSTL